MSEVAVLPAREDGYTRKKWDATEFHALNMLGLLESHQYELFEGEIISTKYKNTNRFARPALEDSYAYKEWIVADCKAMLESGLFDLTRYELLGGEIVSKMPQGRPHIAVITLIARVLAALFGALAVQSQAPIGIGQTDPSNDPEPDFAVLRGTVLDYINHLPDPAADVLLVVEVSDSTLRSDINTKARLYAQNGLREYWIVAITRRELIVHRNPTAQGYTDVQTYTTDDSISPLAAPGASARVADMLPPSNPA